MNGLWVNSNMLNKDNNIEFVELQANVGLGLGSVLNDLYSMVSIRAKEKELSLLVIRPERKKPFYSFP